jgi:hypothetical protein
MSRPHRCRRVLLALLAAAVAAAAAVPVAEAVPLADPQAATAAAAGDTAVAAVAAVANQAAPKQLPRPPEEQQVQQQENPRLLMDAWLERFFRQQAEHPARTDKDFAEAQRSSGVSLLERLIGKEEGSSCGVNARHL